MAVRKALRKGRRIATGSKHECLVTVYCFNRAFETQSFGSAVRHEKCKDVGSNPNWQIPVTKAKKPGREMGSKMKQ